MARRSKEQLNAEIERIEAILRLQMAFLAEIYPNDREIYEQALPERGVRAEAGPLSAVLRGYEGALKEFNAGLIAQPEFTDRWLAFYAERTGRPYYEDVADPKTILKAALVRGAIRDAVEYRLIKSAMDDGLHAVVTGKNLMRLNTMLRDFETKVT